MFVCFSIFQIFFKKMQMLIYSILYVPLIMKQLEAWAGVGLVN
jgi:hypothetical protein